MSQLRAEYLVLFSLNPTAAMAKDRLNKWPISSLPKRTGSQLPFFWSSHQLALNLNWLMLQFRCARCGRRNQGERCALRLFPVGQTSSRSSGFEFLSAGLIASQRPVDRINILAL